jgi:hypothetical protein
MKRTSRLKTIQCPSGKVRHSSDLAAARALGRARDRARAYGEPEPVRFYRCPMCSGGYHLTKAELKTEGFGNTQDRTTRLVAAD